MLLHYTIVLFLLCKIYLTGAVNSVSKFEYCSNGNTNLHRILKEVSSVGSRIQCAAVCQNHPDCKGYGYAQNKTCYLLGTGNGHCTEKDCTSWHNIKIYTVMLPHSLNLCLRYVLY